MSDLTCIWVAKLSSVAWSHGNLQTCIISFSFHASGEFCLLSMRVNLSRRLCGTVQHAPRKRSITQNSVINKHDSRWGLVKEPIAKCETSAAIPAQSLCRGLEKSDASGEKEKKKYGAFRVEWEAEKKQQHEERFPLSSCSIEIWPAVMETDRNNFGKSSWVIRSSPSTSTSRSCSNACVPRKTITTPGRRWPWIARIKEINTGSEPLLIVKLLW